MGAIRLPVMFRYVRLRHLAAWSHEAGASYTTLRDCCYMLDIRPQAARDFARLLRVALWSPTIWRPDALLFVSDPRTLRRLTRAAGLTTLYRAPNIVDEYLNRQQLVPRDSVALVNLRSKLHSVRPLATHDQ